ncbi:hypothetical protein T4D_9908 [Trichinella pseudospiralis]|uniref:Uncharacterized protein n=1 Tax=Trichinella pseudospiralis TaxID=6337 RepID=A0A0V1DRV1_TRIPS|nr:hypothetical protein T4D_13329 [Trichinella pseudospiralis]KRY68702.1 hypothetical protein T4D_9908 [Trichinella pseudospiralis]
MKKPLPNSVAKSTDLNSEENLLAFIIHIVV